MKTKIYAYAGHNYATIDVLNANNGRVQVSFRGGDIMSKDGYAPACTAPIMNPVVQALIEKHPLFLTGEIYVYSEAEVEDGIKEVEKTPVPEVTDFVSACEYLKANFGAKASQLRSPIGARGVAAAHNIEFPNWK